MRGRLITFEGIDGVGKTTHLALARELLRGRGLVVRAYREPGSTALGEQLRLLIKGGAMESPLAELLLFAAARAELVDTRIRPALDAGEYVMLDRFTESTLAYQGALQKIADEALAAVCAAATGGLVPDLTLWLDIPPEDALSRRFPLAEAFMTGASDGPAPATDHIEQRNTDYFCRVRKRYAQLQAAQPARIRRIDASGPKEVTAAAVRGALEDCLKEWNVG